MLAGKLSGTMSHDQTYDFLRMGRNMERADMTTRVIDVRGSNLLPTHSEELKPFDDIQWKSVLDSLQYTLSEVEQCLRTMPGNEAALRVLGRAQRMVQRVDVSAIVGTGLNEFINELQLVHSELNGQLTASFFEAAEEPAEARLALA
jgi:uncharacterized alpha-E superfamily protein